MHLSLTLVLFGMNIIKFPRPDTTEAELRPFRQFYIQTRPAPVTRHVTYEDGTEADIETYTQIPDVSSIPDFCDMSADDLTLQAQIDAGVQLQETRPIAPDTLDAVTAAMCATARGLNNPKSYDTPNN